EGFLGVSCRRVSANPEIVEHRQPRKGARNLEGATDAEPADAVRLETDELVAGKHHLAAVCLQEPIKEIEQRCLAGTIRPYDTDDLAVTDLEAHVCDRPQTTERFRNPAHHQYRFARRRRRRRSRDNVRCKRCCWHGARCVWTLEPVAHAPENAFRGE